MWIEDRENSKKNFKPFSVDLELYSSGVWREIVCLFPAQEQF